MESLLNSIHKRHANMLIVFRKLIMRKAKAIYNESVGNDRAAQEGVVASCGWLEKFMQRNTTIALKDPSHVIDKYMACVLQV